MTIKCKNACATSAYHHEQKRIQKHDQICYSYFGGLNVLCIFLSFIDRHLTRIKIHEYKKQEEHDYSKLASIVWKIL